MSAMHRRLARLEAGEQQDDCLPLLTIDEVVLNGGAPAPCWPDTTAGVRFSDGAERYRREGESVAAFRRRLCVEQGARGPVGSLPHDFVELILSAEPSVDGLVRSS